VSKTDRLRIATFVAAAILVLLATDTTHSARRCALGLRTVSRRPRASPQADGLPRSDHASVFRSWPELSQFGWQDMFDVFDLALCHPLRQQREDRTRCHLGIETVGA
jgi:hypothetical protein